LVPNLKFICILFQWFEVRNFDCFVNFSAKIWIGLFKELGTKKSHHKKIKLAVSQSSKKPPTQKIPYQMGKFLKLLSKLSQIFFPNKIFFRKKHAVAKTEKENFIRKL
jgi:hypothetical protein